MILSVVGVVLVALGLAIGWYGLRPLAVVPEVLRTDVRNPSDVRDPNAVTEGGSFAVCRGVATASDETTSAPFTGTRCLGFEFEVTERQPFGIGIPWFRAHLDDGVATRPFALDGPGGGVDVVPSPRRFTLDTPSTVVTVAADDSPPDRIQRFVDVREALDPVAGWMAAIPGLGTRRYVERRIDPGEEYVVAGPTERRHGEVVLAGDLVITDRSPIRFAIARLRTAAGPVLLSLVFVGAGLWGIVG